MEWTKMELTLLSVDQVFGSGKIDVIEKMGGACSLTDFAIACGAKVYDDETASEESLRDRKGRWFLSSVSGVSDVGSVNEKGERRVAYANASGGLRPVFSCEDASCFDERSSNRRGLMEIKYGEYPGYAADRSRSRKLEGEYASGRLLKTGKRYEEEYDEYVLDNEKYIRMTYLSQHPDRLSDGRSYREGDPVWIKVEPVEWIWDEKAKLMVSRHIVAFVPKYSRTNEYDGNFEKTRAGEYLNRVFAKDLIPSVVRELSAEEKTAHEEEVKELEKKRNPYGLTFGEATEEDIIRGAIESDVAVFLHGPSSEGKSARVKQIDPTCEIIYLRNATPDSLNGRSVYNQETGEMIDIPPTWFKKVKEKCEAEPDRFHVVFFDEINNALPSIQGMAFNIVLDREVNGLWKLPDNARVVAAGNDMQDSLAANEIAAPFFNRFAHVYINTTTEKWLRWARNNNIHPAIYAFIAYRQGEPLRSEYDGKKPNADPRKWEMASKMLYTTGRPEMLRALIGEDITDEFVRFCSQPVITLDKVISGDYTDEDIEGMNTAERYATVMGLSQAGEEDLGIVRDFTGRLGAEFRGLFDSMWVQGDKKRQEYLEDMLAER